MTVAPEMDISLPTPDRLSTHDRGLLYGDGVFETIRCRANRLILGDLHQRRLLYSCKQLGIPVDASWLERWLHSLAASAPSPDLVLKVIVTRGEGGRGYAPPAKPNCTWLAQWHELPPAISDAWHAGIDCLLCEHPLSENIATAGIKHLNRLDQVMASRELAAAALLMPSIREGLMFDQHSRVIEGTRSNLFVVIDGQAYTPDLSRSGVAGVMRQWVLETLSALGKPATVTDLDRNALSLASEMFICNSVFGLWPVSQLVRLEQNNCVQLANYDNSSLCRLVQARAHNMFI